MIIIQSGDIEKNPGPARSLLINHINAHSLCPSDRSKKIDEIYSSLCIREAVDIICISETWLHASISDNDVSLPDYQLFRKDRVRGIGDGIGGGSAIYIHESIPAKHRPDLENKDLEMVLCEIIHQKKKFIIASCYRPPGMAALLVNNFINNMQAFFSAVCAENPEACFLLGDLNDHCLNWNSDHRLSELKNRLVDLVNINNFFQVINEPTHTTPTNHSLLDLIITDAPGYIIDSGTHAPMGDNFHCRIFCKVRVRFEREPAYKRLIWNYETADFKSINDALSNAPWMTLDIFDNIDDGVDYFETLLLNAAREYIPNKTYYSPL